MCWLWSCEIARVYRRHELSPVEVVDSFLARIERLNPALNAYVLVTADKARDAARAASERLMRETDLPPLYGIPFSVKDTLPTAGVRTTFGSPLFRDFVP